MFDHRFLRVDYRSNTLCDSIAFSQGGNTDGVPVIIYVRRA